MPVKVSVVVPVYNPGEHIDPLIRSLQEQSMPQSDFEAVFVDDGSSDETPARLDRLAETHDNVTVIHIPNSGWPGRPRNIGIETAVGEYVQFVDHDDELGPEALERLYAYAREHGSDVVVGKEVRRTGSWTMGPIFDENRPHATLEHDPILGILTPHKMFRRAFLDEHHIRFLEGPRRLEDHPFVMEAYFLADVISVLSDYPVYYWNRRPDHGNASARPFDWAEYYVYLRDVLDVVERHTEPGDVRDRLLGFWYDRKGLGVLTRSVSRRPREAVRRHFDALRDLAEERFPRSVDNHLVGVTRVRSELLRAGDFEGIVTLGRVQHGIRLEQELTELRVTDDRLHVRLRAGLCYEDGSPVSFEVDDGRYLWRPPVDLGPAVTREALDFTVPYRAKRVELGLRNRRTAEPHVISGTVHTPEVEHGAITPFSFEVTFEVDPETAGTGGPLERGFYEVFLRASCDPWRLLSRLRSLPDAVAGGPATGVLRTSRTVLAFTTPGGAVALDVNQQRHSVLEHVSPSPTGSRLREHPDGIALVLPLDGLRLSGRPVRGRLRLVPESGETPFVVGLRILPGREGGSPKAKALVPTRRQDAGQGLGPGRWKLVAVVQRRRTDLGLVLDVDPRGGATLSTRDGDVLSRVPRRRGGARLLSRSRYA